MASPQRRPALTKAQIKPHPVAPSPPGKDQAPPTGASVATPTPTATLSARIPEELRDAVKLYAAAHRESVQHIVTEAVRRYIHE
jgi:hypothetical protein